LATAGQHLKARIHLTPQGYESAVSKCEKVTSRLVALRVAPVRLLIIDALIGVIRRLVRSPFTFNDAADRPDMLTSAAVSPYSPVQTRAKQTPNYYYIAELANSLLGAAGRACVTV